MATFDTISVVPIHHGDEQRDTRPPDCSLWAAWPPVLKNSIVAELARPPEPEPDADAARDTRTMVLNIQQVGRIVVQVTPIRHTAAIVDVARFEEPPEPSTRMATLVLLAGFPDADAVTLDLAAALPAFQANPAVLEQAQAWRRPLMIQCFPDREAFEHPLAHVLAQATADAFFSQFGQSLAHAV